MEEEEEQHGSRLFGFLINNSPPIIPQIMDLCCRFCLKKPINHTKNVFLPWNEWPHSIITSAFEKISHSKVCTFTEKVLSNFIKCFLFFIFQSATHRAVSCLPTLFRICLRRLCKITKIIRTIFDFIR